jgi:hypothetical protein
VNLDPGSSFKVGLRYRCLFYNFQTNWAKVIECAW